MSGGHFEYNQYKCDEMADQIDRDIAHDECPFQAGTIERFRLAAKTLRLAYIMAQRVDWLMSGDDGEEDFHRRWDEDLKEQG